VSAVASSDPRRLAGIRVTHGALWAVDLRLPLGDADMTSRFAVCEVVSYRGVQLAGMASDDLQARYEQGRRLFAAYEGERIVGWCWLTYGSAFAPPLGRELNFASDECYGYDASVSEDRRGHGIFTAILARMARTVRREGAYVLWGGILDSNLASRRSNRAAGFQPVLRTVAVSRGRRSLLWTHPVEYADQRLVERAQEIVRDRPAVVVATSQTAH
jgi:GNAT superfamily N-acetyltransferase